jgi:hypothetical protein
MHQSVLNPLGSQPAPQAQPAAEPVAQPQKTPTAAASQPEPATNDQKPPVNPPPTTSETVVSPDIISLANNSDLSIETIAHEANRIHEKEEKKLPEDEVVISLR